jgi:hypothetical protein
MLATLVWALADRPGSPAPTRRPAIVPPAASRTRPAQPPPAARAAARRFLLAFLADEVGDSRSAAVEIRAGAVPALADVLLERRRPRRAGRQREVEIASLRVDRLPGHPDLVLASGSARRPSALEPFAFLFVRRRGRWLALAPGE